MIEEAGRPKAGKRSLVLKVLKAFLALVAVVVLAGAGLSFCNDQHYGGPEYSFEPAAYYDDPSDLSLYPTDIKGVTVSRIDEGSLQGFHLVPDELRHKGVIVVYGGSEGTPGFERAADFAQEGYEVLSLFMFGADNQPKTLVRVPLEQFDGALRFIEEHAASPSPLTVVGASKGAEYALNLASRYPQIDNVILVAPSAYTYNGLDFDSYGSSWTWQGEELPYVDVIRSDLGAYLSDMLLPMMTKGPVKYREVYQAAVDMDVDEQAKRIPLDTEARILAIAGSDDRMWNSAGMGQLIQEQRPEGTELAIYDGAGHIFGGNGIISLQSMRIEVGGSADANERAGKESRELMLQRLSEWHPGV